MPGPIIKDIIPDWMKPENTSVFDPLYVTLLRKALHATGLDTAEGQAQTFLNPTPTGLISAYTNKQERSAATELFKKAAEAMGPQVKAAGEAFAAKYPRIAAHINLKKSDSYIPQNIKGYPKDAPAGGYARTSDFAPQHGRKQMEVGITPEGMRSIEKPLGYDFSNVPGAKPYHKLQDEWTDEFKANGLAVDITYGVGASGNRVRVRKWGSDYNNPQNFVDPSTLPKYLQDGIDFLSKGADDYLKQAKGEAAAKDLLFHEGTHVAQKLGNKDFDSLYHMANEMQGYKLNPFEIAANDAGKAAIHGEPNYRPTTAIQLLDDAAYHRTKGATGPVDPNVQKNAEWIRKLIDYRKNKGWRPKGYDKPLQTFNEILDRNKSGITSQFGERPIEKDLLMPSHGPLPTDFASRMKRAEEMGYNMDVFHGTRRNFKEFDPAQSDLGIHVTPDPETANRAVPYTLTGLKPGSISHGSNVLPLKAKVQRSLLMPDVGLWRDPQHWLRRLEDPQLMNQAGKAPISQQILEEATPEEAAALKELFEAAGTYNDPKFYTDPHLRGRNAWSEQARNILKRHGYDSIAYQNDIEGKGELSYMLLNPSQLRSRNAMFDPARAKSGDLLASLAAMLGVGGAAASQEKE